MSALIGCAIAWVAPTDVGATCLNPRTILYHLDEDLFGPSESIYVYINAPDDPNGPPCPQDVRRSGFSVEDFETIVNAAIASINDASSTKPRLVYGGRVCHETNYSCTDTENLPNYADEFEMITGRPPGVTIQVRPCGTNVGGIGGVKGCDRSVYGERGSELLNLTAFRADDSTLCPRSGGFNENDPDCHVDSPDIVVGDECFDDGATSSCTCTDLDAVGQEYDGMHICAADDDMVLKWSDCMCRRRGYEAYNRGDGQAHPDEPIRCDSLGADDTKDLQAVLTHELGHILGLGHTQSSGEQCPGPTSPNPADDPYEGVMRSVTWPNQIGQGHLYHFDDLRGLDWLYTIAAPGESGPYAGEPAFNRTWRYAYFESTDGQNWSDAIEFELPNDLSTSSMKRVAVSSAADGTGFQAVAFTNEDAELFVVTRDDMGFHDLEADEARVPDAVTRYPAAVAYGGDNLMVAWLDQPDDSRFSDVRYAIRDRTPGSVDWTTHVLDDFQPGDTVRKYIGLGYEPVNGIFILATIKYETWFDGSPLDAQNGVPWLLFIDPESGTLVQQEILEETGVVHSIGKPVCHTALVSEFATPVHCALPVAAIPTPAPTGGPDLSLIYFGLLPNAQDLTYDVFQTDPTLQVHDVRSLAAIDLAIGATGSGDELFVGSVTTLDDNGQPLFGVYATEDISPISGLPFTPLGVEPLDGADILPAPGELGEPVVPSWSLAMGSRRNGGTVTYSAWRPVADQPDGGVDTGDEGEEGTEDEGTAGTETAGADDGPGGNGCNCEIDTRPERPWSGLLLFGLVLWRGPRRSSRNVP